MEQIIELVDCKECNGTGKVDNKKCTNCNGKGKTKLIRQYAIITEKKEIRSIEK